MRQAHFSYIGRKTYMLIRGPGSPSPARSCGVRHRQALTFLARRADTNRTLLTLRTAACFTTLARQPS